MTIIEKQTQKNFLSDRALGTQNALGAGGALIATTLTVESIRLTMWKQRTPK